MNTSKMIAALLGPVFLVTGIMLFVNLGVFPDIVRDISGNPMLLLLAGYMTFVPGLVIVILHNRWSAGWPLLVTLCGWLFLVAGLIRIVFAYRLSGVVEGIAAPILSALPVVAAIMLLFGAILTFQGLRRG